MKSLVLLSCIQVSQEQAHGGTKSPKQAGDLEWFGCVWQKELLVWICLGHRSQSSVCRALFFSSVTAPWKLSAVLSWDTSHGTKVPDLGEIQAGTSGGHSSSTSTGPTAAWWCWHGTDPTAAWWHSRAPSLSETHKNLAFPSPASTALRGCSWAASAPSRSSGAAGLSISAPCKNT